MLAPVGVGRLALAAMIDCIYLLRYVLSFSEFQSTIVPRNLQ